MIGTQSVPIGRYSREILHKAGAQFTSSAMKGIASHENNVRLLRTKVVLGEADAAMVYRTDTRSVSGLKVIEIPRNLAVIALYTMGRTPTGAAHPATEHWTRFVQSPSGQVILQRHGFLAP